MNGFKTEKKFLDRCSFIVLSPLRGHAEHKQNTTASYPGNYKLTLNLQQETNLKYAIYEDEYAQSVFVHIVHVPVTIVE